MRFSGKCRRACTLTAFKIQSLNSNSVAAAQLLAYLMQLAGVGVIIAVMPQYWDYYSRQVMIHISVGIACEFLAGMQVSDSL